ncbi:MAG: hypothetical protein KGJ43_00395 [Acidobacteriota bacterium]|nr:hypothetical protein [Acidobacteriota bacterium]
MNPSIAELTEHAPGDAAAAPSPGRPDPRPSGLDGSVAVSRPLPEWGAGAGAVAHERSLPGALANVQVREALVDTWQALWRSRLLVWLAGAGAVLAFGFGPDRKVIQHAALTHGFGSLGDLLVAPAARWDAAWYLLIAHAGYGPSLGSATAARSAFYPLYPLAVHLLSFASLTVAGILVSVAALATALYLLHRLSALEVRTGTLAVGHARSPREVARLAVGVLAFSPMAFFLSAIYSESLYLALSIAVFWFARRGRWALVGTCGALAGATRPTGILLLAPAAILYLYGPREDRPPDRGPGGRGWRRIGPAGLMSASPLLGSLRTRYWVRPDVLWLTLMPAGLLLFMAYLGLAGGDVTTPFSAQSFWGRELAGPFSGLWSGATAAFDGLRQLISGQAHHAYLAQATGNPLVNASHNLLLFCFAVGALAAAVGVLRRLPLAYGAYTVLALALPVSYPVRSEPLMSLPRFLLVLFPMSMWAAAWLAGRRRTSVATLALSALALVFFTGAFATWHWVS